MPKRGEGSKRLPGWLGHFLSDPGVPGVRSMGHDVSTRLFADLTDVTLADEDSNSIPTDDVNRANLQLMQVVPSVGQHWN